MARTKGCFSGKSGTASVLDGAALLVQDDDEGLIVGFGPHDDAVRADAVGGHGEIPPVRDDEIGHPRLLDRHRPHEDAVRPE